MKGPATPFGSTVFCDDIREEVSGKLTFIGVYTKAMVVQSGFPIEIPTFSIYVRYYERLGESHSPVTVCVFLPGDAPDAPTISEKLEIEAVRERARNTAPPVIYDDPLLPMDFFVTLSPFRIASEGQIKVRAYRDGQEIRLGAMTVSQKSES